MNNLEDINGFALNQLAKIITISTKCLLVSAISTSISLSAFAVESEITDQEKEEKEEIEVIVVSGIRSSMAKAQELKRESASVIEAITAEDLGKFSDENIGDALARVPGVQIERNDGGQSGDRISIRGMGPSFVATTVNGRTSLSSGTEGLNNMRSFNLDVLPSFLFTGATVSKMPTADSVELGLAGSVDMQTLKPLDGGLYKSRPNGEKDNFFSSIQLQTSKDSIVKELGHNASILIGGKTNDDKFGYYLGYSTRQQDIGTDQIITDAPHFENLNIDEDGDGTVDRIAEDVIVPFWVGNEPIRMDRKRETISGAIQWSPNEDIQLVVDFNHATLDDKSFRNRVADGYWTGIWANVINADSIRLNEDETVLQYADFSGFNGGNGSPVVHQALALQYDNKTEMNMLGANLSWLLTDKLIMEVDLSYSSIDYGQQLRYGLISASIPSNSTFYDVTGDYPTNGHANGIENSAETYIHEWNEVRYIAMEGDDYALKVDFDYDIDNGLVDNIMFGARYNSVDILSKRSSVVSNPDIGEPRNNEDIVEAIFPGTYSDLNFMDGSFAFPILDLDGYKNSYPEHAYAQGVCSDVTEKTVISNTQPYCLAQDPNSLADSKEETLALYGQAFFIGEVMEMDWDFNAGVRVINVQNTGAGIVRLANGNDEKVTTKGDYTEVLPNANLSLHLNENVTWRLGAGKVLTRPEQSDLVPRISIENSGPDSDPNALRKGTAGNSELSPYTGWLLDSTLELYTPNDGSIVLSVFYKDVKDFIAREVTQGTIPGYGDEQFIVNKPLNISDADVIGFEIGFNQPFTFLPGIWSGLGLQANYTKVKSSFDESNKVGDFGFGMPGSSENNANAILYYENNGIGVRLSATYRDDYFASLNPQQAELSAGIFSESSVEVSLGTSYEINENLSVNFDVQNMFEEDRRDFAIGNLDAFSSYFKRPRRVTLGLTIKM
jgi:TonB-dependent receptor